MNSFFLFIAFFVAFTVALKGPLDGYQVQQIHIAQGRTPESMTISWVTKEDAKSQVSFGLMPSQLDLKSEGYKTSYDFNYPDFGMYESGVIHHVTLTNLRPNTVYFYRCGDLDADATSGLLSFRTMPRVGDQRPMKFGVIGDLGQTTDSQSTMQHVMMNPDLGMILHAGDLSYADCNQTKWDTYGLMIEDLAKARPWMVGPGNHEVEYNSDGSIFLSYESRYKMPAIKPAEFGAVTIQAAINPATGKPWCASSVFQMEYNYGSSFYSFETGLAHVIYLNPYSVTNTSSVQYNWLESDLASVDRSVTPWILVVMHCPWYNSNLAHVNEEQAVLMREAMEPLLYKYHVNFVMTGHVHAYERTHPVFRDKRIADGVMYVTIGDGGNAEGHAINYTTVQPEWSAYRNGTQYGHAELTLLSPQKMAWRWMRNVDGQMISQDDVILCNTALNNNANCV
mmetsp:Transcript_2363/g.1695  ORF Transcript_2363/g.1695 Transcript_2363/m.1695 type:complete len:452 (+) Transcript_2363:54-1409(+)|eukprot:CAMPEP_0202958082 /NCGR_PEP_ID=MMETSP1396-20130829/2426_1 /ASSEMBLY_ACC=CAM_ASM_000872 /TAXON_ID= /ORGANISM="Pseudokeronopsis sp., Strain Brazil" /LENGTH=451 /DNA_ID=CAMNT_0049675925 /DNA_START=49 /DNA_END=1404 /DNA_ORIENTATION=-